LAPTADSWIDRVKLAGRLENVNPGVPAPSSRLCLAPSERSDIIVDFSGLQGHTFILTDDGQTPSPAALHWTPAIRRAA
jgi:hypothetical protein